MDIRYLQADKADTRQLYEHAFTEDSPLFVDYYYTEVIKNNYILGAFRDNKLCGMLHLNPYSFVWNQKKLVTDYMVAVATIKEYRRQGIMTELLKKALQDMRKKGLPFTYLMPADKAIYEPFGFRFFSVKKEAEYCKTVKNAEFSLQTEEIGEQDYEPLAGFVNKQLSERYWLYTEKSADYYRRLYREAQTEQGGIRVLRKNGQIEGCYIYHYEDNKLHLWEPVCTKDAREQLLDGACMQAEGRKLQIAACDFLDDMVKVKKSPFMMGRICNLEEFFKKVSVKEESSFVWHITDELLPENTGLYRVTWGKRENTVEKLNHTDRECLHLKIEDIIPLFFADKNIFINEWV